MPDVRRGTHPVLPMIIRPKMLKVTVSWPEVAWWEMTEGRWRFVVPAYVTGLVDWWEYIETQAIEEATGGTRTWTYTGDIRGAVEDGYAVPADFLSYEIGDGE